MWLNITIENENGEVIELEFETASDFLEQYENNSESLLPDSNIVTLSYKEMPELNEGKCRTLEKLYNKLCAYL